MDSIFQNAKLRSVKKGEILIRPYDQSSNLFRLKSGAVHAYTIEKNGSKNVHILYGKEDIFPIYMLTKDQPLNIYYEAMQDSRLLQVDVTTARDLMKQNAQIAIEALKQVTEQFVYYKARVDNLEYRYARERIAYRLLLLAKKFGTVKDGCVYMPRFSQDEIGSSSNVSREGVSRELRRFEKQRYIAYESNKMILINQHGLRSELSIGGADLFIDSLLDEKL